MSVAIAHAIANHTQKDLPYGQNPAINGLETLCGKPIDVGTPADSKRLHRAVAADEDGPIIHMDSGAVVGGTLTERT